MTRAMHVTHGAVQRVERQRARPLCTCGVRGYRRAKGDWLTCAECGGRLRSDEELEDYRREELADRYARED